MTCGAVLVAGIGFLWRDCQKVVAPEFGGAGRCPFQSTWLTDSRQLRCTKVHVRTGAVSAGAGGFEADALRRRENPARLVRQGRGVLAKIGSEKKKMFFGGALEIRLSKSRAAKKQSTFHTLPRRRKHSIINAVRYAMGFRHSQLCSPSGLASRSPKMIDRPAEAGWTWARSEFLRTALTRKHAENIST